MRKNKYGNKKVVYQGIKFDSIKERNRFIELNHLQKKGLIKDLELQPKFVLQPSFKYNGKTERGISYYADFMYIENGLKVVEDVKSAITKVNPLYRVKVKMLLFKYGGGIIFKEK